LGSVKWRLPFSVFWFPSHLILFVISSAIRNRFGRSTSLYASWLILLIVVGEYTTGKITDGLWTANNYGKTFATVDWSKFDQFEDDDEEEEDDDDDDDDE
jgi:hypothetical protein